MLRKKDVVNTAFNQYIIEQQIGEGGNGTVYKAKTELGDFFAIKAIDRNSVSKEKLKRFRNEIHFCLNNKNKNIIKVIDYGTFCDDIRDIIFYVMPLYQSTLRKEMEEGMSSERIFYVFSEILNGLEFTHSKKVWHRDLKPENILINENEVVIADFGIAHFYEEQQATSIETNVRSRLANFCYSAPEQKRNNSAVDEKCDIYALGLILNEMFTGNVISGSKYTKVCDINKECGYIDDLIEQMITQSKDERIYPVEKIRSSFNYLTRKNNIEKDINKLTNTKVNEVEEFYFECPYIIDLKYENNYLEIYLNKDVPAEWNNILLFEEFSRSELMGYEKNRFKFNSSNMYSIFVANTSEGNMETIVSHFKSWLDPTNRIYVERENKRRISEKRAKEKALERLLIEKEKEKEINNKLKMMI